ncbi:hypothetical protein M422DRAFT_53199 [Sphaerobolus stellatus SS14]|uniref:Uncharacterized protein n=1 Tax=Sphaerobolus stellatus (strain SS14) TaxID=990650 RepID=A0A0C9UB69_SPHS4|nr:hypothetical protein M422DRAFT_53199 [Sphaerobolus stellatus SS14]
MYNIVSSRPAALHCPPNVGTQLPDLSITWLEHRDSAWPDLSLPDGGATLLNRPGLSPTYLLLETFNATECFDLRVMGSPKHSVVMMDVCLIGSEGSGPEVGARARTGYCAPPRPPRGNGYTPVLSGYGAYRCIGFGFSVDPRHLSSYVT